jgi:putative transposase
MSDMLSPAIDARARYTGADVVATLERVLAYGVPKTIRVDNVLSGESRAVG